MENNTETTTNASDTRFVRVSREQFDAVLRVGTREMINQLPSWDSERLHRAERWAEDIRREKDAKTYLTFPVSKPKQQAAGRLYLQALSAFRTAVRTELAQRATSLFDAPGIEEAVQEGAPAVA
jgi:hypothetical protein